MASAAAAMAVGLSSAQALAQAPGEPESEAEQVDAPDESEPSADPTEPPTRDMQPEVAPSEPTRTAKNPALPDGMTLEETLARAAQPPPDHFPEAIHDDRILTFFRGDQAEYRLAPSSGPNVLGWEANAWIGGDFNRLFLKPEGELSASEWDEGESENDILYSRLVFPFWSAQIGAQYANKWAADEDYSDRVSGAVAVQGLAPGKFEIDASVYLSQDLDVTGTLELEYDYRITQRLVLQPRTELSFAAQDVAERGLGGGLTDLVAGVRLRYEIKRELAPYLGIRYQRQVFGTADRTRAASGDVSQVYLLGGIRFALL